MKFEDLINDIEKLIGLSLLSINPITRPITISRLDRVAKRYFLRVDDSGKEVGRPFKELLDIWNHLVLHGYANVDQALSGAGSSRNQPETVISHLPYIEHFRFENKKHLLLRSSITHPIGTQKELSTNEQRSIKRNIEKKRDFNARSICRDLESSLNRLKKSIDTINKKYPGDVLLNEFENSIFEIKKIHHEIVSTVVSLDGIDSNLGSNQLFPADDDLRSIESDLLVDSPMYTGIEEGTESSDEDGDENELIQDVNLVTLGSNQSKPNFRRQTPTFSLLYDRLTYNEIEIQPEYQRKDRIWKKPLKSKLIESILMGLPLPIFYFGERANGNWIVIDGLQRLTTIQDFMLNRFALSGLKHLKNKNDCYFKDLSRLEIRKLRESEITAYIVDAKKENERSIIELFHRINTYGVLLSEQEIRNAINSGSSVSYLRFLANTNEFFIATDNKVNPNRQKDIELCLAPIAYMLFGYKSYNYNKYDEFLSNAMKALNGEQFDEENQIANSRNSSDITSEAFIGSELLKTLTIKFKSALTFAREIFGDAVFRKGIYATKAEPISKPLFELIIAVFSNLSFEQRKMIFEKRAKFLELFYMAIKSDSKEYADWESIIYSEKDRGFNYALSQSTGKRVTVLYRFETLVNIIKASTGCEVNFVPFLNPPQND